MKLSELHTGQSGVVTKILGHGAFRKRVMEMGFVPGCEVKAVVAAPLQDPVKYSLRGYEVSLRRSEGSMVEVKPLDGISAEEHNDKPEGFREGDRSDKLPASIHDDKVINVALIGNPNCGKTSLFNLIAGAREHVGNYAGVTVDAKEGSLLYRGYRINVMDLPGTYSLSAYSPEEVYVVKYLRNETPDVIVNVTVASNLERNLYLTTELIDMNRSMVIALNMYDEIEKAGIRLEYDKLGQLIGVPIVPTSASKGKGIHELLDDIIKVYELQHPDTRHIHVYLGSVLEKSVNALKDAIKADKSITAQFAPRFLAIKLLQGDPEVEKMLSTTDNYKELKALRDRQTAYIEKELGQDSSSAIAAAKYGFIEGALTETMDKTPAQEAKSTEIIDSFVTNKLFGFPLFILVMLFMFWATFEIGAYPMEWIESAVDWLGGVLGRALPDGPVHDLVIDGIIGGVGGVIVFLPNILILYFFISFMEDSGYMARVAFIMDKLMHKMGLHGKSFIPLIMGFGCNVPAIMSTRIIESRSSRLITILINPFISCSARLPIYVLLVGIFFPEHGALVFLGLYLLGVVVAVITARLLRKFWFKKDETPFVMELPPYRMPTMRSTLYGMWTKAEQYLKKMGGIILVASIIIWALSYFPRQEESAVPPQLVQSVKASLAENQTDREQAGAENEDSVVVAESELSEEQLDAQAMELALGEYQQRNSILGHVGRFIEPAVKPLGFDWKNAVALLAGAGAKEIVVSTLGVLYTGTDADEARLSSKLTTPNPETGEPPFTPLKALGFMVFVLLYFPCIATVTAIYRETESWRYPLFTLVYNTGIAYLFSLAVYQIGSLL